MAPPTITPSDPGQRRSDPHGVDAGADPDRPRPVSTWSPPDRSGDRSRRWAATMTGSPTDFGLVVAHHVDGHHGRPDRVVAGRPADRLAREEAEATSLAGGATAASGAGHRARPEPPDPWRTCFERDRDRILHATAFRRLAGKTQVFVHPADHQRTRLTHALEVAQVATSVARAVGLNATLVEAMALGHDCGHGPGGHASEDAFDSFIPGFHHARWGAEVVLAPLNLCAETLDGIGNHSWSLPAPATPEGELLSWADRIAYCTHDLEDAVRAGIVDAGDLPDAVRAVAGTSRSAQLRTFINALIDGVCTHGVVAMDGEPAGALASLRAFNYERVYMRPESVAQADAVVAVLGALVAFFLEHPTLLPVAATPPWAAAPTPDRIGPRQAPDTGTSPSPAAGAGDEPTRAATGATGEPDETPDDTLRRVVTYVAGMTDRFAFDTAIDLLGWDPARLPIAVDRHRR